MSKRNNTNDVAPSRLRFLQTDDGSFEDEEKPTSSQPTVVVNMYDDIDPEFLVTALDEIKEFVDYQNIPIAQFLTTEHLEEFIRQHK